LLARNGYSLTGLENYCEENGFTFESRYRNPLKSQEFKTIISYQTLVKGGIITENECRLILRYMYGNNNYEIKTNNEGIVDLNHFISRYNINKQVPWFEALKHLTPRVAQYFRNCLRNKEKLLDKKPRIKISTIHGAKGAESDNVLLLSDISQKTYNSMEVNQDNEHRVFYVGCTRAILNLCIVSPSTKFYYDI
jgi:hypothetical protein